MQVVLLQLDGKECHALQFVHRSSTSSKEAAMTVYCPNASNPVWGQYPYLHSPDLEYIAATVNRFLEDSLGQNVPSYMLTSSHPAADPESAADEEGLFGRIPFAPPQAPLASHDLPLRSYQGIKSIERTGEGGVKVTLRDLRLQRIFIIKTLEVISGLWVVMFLILIAMAWAQRKTVYGLSMMVPLAMFAGLLARCRQVLVRDPQQPSQLTVGCKEWSLVQHFRKPTLLPMQPCESVQNGRLADLTCAKVCILSEFLHMHCIDISGSLGTWSAVGEHFAEAMRLPMHDPLHQHPLVMTTVLLKISVLWFGV
jgi:hypothetical protein